MIVSSKGRYAVGILAALAARGGSGRLSELIAEQGLPRKYAEAIMNVLAKAGFVESTRGRGGGYRLTRAPADYTLEEILRETETSLFAAECTADDAECPHAASCPSFPVWRALDETVSAFLAAHTLADLVPKET